MALAAALVAPLYGRRGGDEAVRLPARAAPSAIRVTHADAAPAGQPGSAREAATGLLQRQAHAIQARDANAYLATIDPQSVAYRTQASRNFAQLIKLPYTRWTFQLGASQPFELSRSRAQALGGQAYTLEATAQYRLTRYDPIDATSVSYLTLVRRAQGWFVADDSDGEAAGKHSTTDIWETGPISVVNGSHSLVIGAGGEERLRPFARAADAAIPRVSAVWGMHWSQRVVLIVAGNQSGMAALLGAPSAQYNNLAAVTTYVAGPDSVMPVERIYINPATWAQMSAVGRRVVITHEITHVAQRTSVAGPVPIWLVEGSADYIGFRGTGLSVSSIAQDLISDMHNGLRPASLPGSKDFDNSNPKLSDAYQEAWLACRLIAHRYGEAKLVALYRSIGSGKTPATAFRGVLGSSYDSFVNAWRAYVRSLA